MTDNIGQRAYDNAFEKRRKLMLELEKLNQFLQLAKEYAGVADSPAPSIAKSVRATPVKVSRPLPLKPLPIPNKPNVSAEKLVARVRGILLKRGQPLTRRQIVDALTEEGVKISARHPVNYLGTVLWRAKGQFTQLEGRGYWPTDVAYAPANYEPSARGAETPDSENGSGFGNPSKAFNGFEGAEPQALR